MVVSIFTSRVVLDVLGVEDYGIYNVVGGFVSMFSIISGTLTVASQRYLSYELGRDNPDIQKVFSVTLFIHFILAIIILLLLETIGVWFLNSKMNINADRMYAANWVFQCSIVTFCVNLISVPYNALIIANERMNVFAFISIFEVTAKLGAVYLLTLFRFDKLIVYALLMLLISITLRLIYSIYCKRNIEGSRFKFVQDKNLYKNMLQFCGWNFIGTTSGILNGQGINILINLFFGVTFNAARGIAEQVNNAIYNFVSNFTMALNPQITKSFASKDYQYMNKLILRGTNYAFYLLWLICLPILIESDFILDLWLKTVPPYALIFVRYAIIYTLCQTLSQTLYAAMLATGKIKKYQIVVGTLNIMAFPVAFLFFKIGLPAEFGYISTIIFSILCLFVRIIMLQDMIPGFRAIRYLKESLLNILLVLILSLGMVLCFDYITPRSNLLLFLLTCLFSVLVTFGCIYFVGLDKSERLFVVDFIRKKFLKEIS